MTEVSPVDLYVPWGGLERERITTIDVERVRFEASDLELVLSVGPQGRLLRLAFEAPVAFRCIGESYRLRTWNNAGESRIGVHVVELSRWVDWLREESAGVLADTPLTHFAVITSEDCIDVVTEHSPEIHWQDREADAG
jgi:hypothetical protein